MHQKTKKLVNQQDYDKVVTQPSNATLHNNMSKAPHSPSAIIQNNNLTMFDKPTNSSFVNLVSDHGDGSLNKKMMSKDLVPLLKNIRD